MLVYRVETKDGTGPFRNRSNGSDVLFNRIQSYYTPFSHPTPCNDGMKFFNDSGSHRFGCSDMEQLITWFAGSEERMRRASLSIHGRKITLARIAGYNRILLKMFKSRGYQVSVYKIALKSVAFGRSQVAFDLQRAKLVKVIAIDELFAGVPI